MVVNSFPLILIGGDDFKGPHCISFDWLSSQQADTLLNLIGGADYRLLRHIVIWQGDASGSKKNRNRNRNGLQAGWTAGYFLCVSVLSLIKNVLFLWGKTSFSLMKRLECTPNHLHSVIHLLNCWVAVMPLCHCHLSGLLSECQHITSVIWPQWVRCKGSEAISSLITPEIERDGAPAVLLLLLPL